MTWWIAHLNTLAYHGVLGSGLKAKAHIHHSMLAQIIYKTLTDPKARAVALKVFGHLIKRNPAALSGRVIGSIFVGYASKGGGAPRGPLLLPRKVKYSANTLNPTIASYGAGILGVIKGIKSVERLMVMLATGNFEMAVCLPRFEDLDIDLKGLEYDPAFNNLIGRLNVTHQYTINGKEIFE